MKTWIASLALVAASLAAHAATAPVKAENAWARASVQGQDSSGAFVTLVASEPVTLTGVSTPAAGIAELHEMKMEGNVMRMRAAETLPVAPGKPLELRPGGFHIMLMDLKGPLMAGTKIPLTLSFKDAKGQASELKLAVPVSVLPPKP